MHTPIVGRQSTTGQVRVVNGDEGWIVMKPGTTRTQATAIMKKNGNGPHAIVRAVLAGLTCFAAGFAGAQASSWTVDRVLAQRGGQLVPLLRQNLAHGGLAITREKANGYRAFAAVDANVKILTGDRQGTPLYGKPFVCELASATP